MVTSSLMNWMDWLWCAASVKASSVLQNSSVTRSVMFVRFLAVGNAKSQQVHPP